MEERLEKLDKALWALRNRVWGGFFHQLAGELLSSELSMEQVVALLHLSHEPANVSAVAGKTGLSAAASSQMIDKLVQRDLVVRSEDPSDRRNKRISLSEKGEELVKKFEQTRSETVKGLLSTIPEEILIRFEQSLEEVLPFLEEIKAKK